MNIPRREFMLAPIAAFAPAAASPAKAPLKSLLHITVGATGFEADKEKMQTVIDALKTAMQKGGDQVLFTGPDVQFNLIHVSNIDGVLAIVKEAEDEE